MKKFLLFLLVAFCAFSLVACGESEDKEKKDDKQEQKDPEQKDPEQKDTVKRDVAAAEAGLSNVLGTGKLYVTSFGQAGFDYAKDIVDEALLGTEVSVELSDNLLTADQVSAGDVVVAVVGYTTKGIDTKVITIQSETARAKAFAEKQGITLIVMQLEGEARRGSSSDPIIAEAVKGADYVFVYEDGKGKGANYDGMYTTTWCKDFANYYEFSEEFNIYEYINILVK